MLKTRNCFIGVNILSENIYYGTGFALKLNEQSLDHCVLSFHFQFYTYLMEG